MAPRVAGDQHDQFRAVQRAEERVLGRERVQAVPLRRRELDGPPAVGLEIRERVGDRREAACGLGRVGRVGFVRPAAYAPGELRFLLFIASRRAFGLRGLEPAEKPLRTRPRAD